MKKSYLLLLSIPLVACSAILGLQEPTLDNTIEGGSDGGNPQDAPDNDVTSADAPVGDGGAATELVNARVSFIALDDASVYYTDQLEQVVGRIGKDGTGQVDLANGAVAGIYPYSVAVDDVDVIWSSIGGLHQCAKTGCGNAPLPIIDDNNNNNPYSTYGIALDTTVSPTMIYVLVATGQNDVLSIVKVPKGTANATPTTFIPTAKTCQSLADLRIYGGDLYFTCGDGTINRAPLATGTIEVLNSAAPQSAGAFVIAGTTPMYFVQYLEQGSIFQMPVAVDAGVTPLALQQGNPAAIDVDTSYLYWVNQGAATTPDNGEGSVVRCSIAQCSQTVKTLHANDDVPSAIEVDDTAIYWGSFGNGLTANSGLWKMPKPP